MTWGKVPLIGIGSVFFIFPHQLLIRGDCYEHVAAYRARAPGLQFRGADPAHQRPAHTGAHRPVRSRRQRAAGARTGGIDGVLIAEPIAGSSGRELALQLKKRHCMAVLLLAAPEHAGTDAALLEQSGVLVLPNDAPESLIVQTIRLLTAVRIQLEQMQHKTEKLEAKVADIRIINRAKLLLVQHLQMTETEAHKYIEKQAMDTSMRRRTIAENIIRTYED